jgi:hypothetical protein
MEGVPCLPYGVNDSRDVLRPSPTQACLRCALSVVSPSPRRSKSLVLKGLGEGLTYVAREGGAAILGCMILGTRAGFYFALFFLLATEAAAQQDAAHSIDAPKLLSRAFVNLYGEDYVQSVKLSTRSRGGSSMTRSMQITRKQSAEPGKALVRFTDPADIRKTSILILENRNASSFMVRV